MGGKHDGERGDRSNEENNSQDQLGKLQDQLQIIIFLVRNRQQTSVVVVVIVGGLLTNREDAGSHSGASIQFLDLHTERIKICSVPAVERQQHRRVNRVDVNFANRLTVICRKILHDAEKIMAQVLVRIN